MYIQWNENPYKNRVGDCVVRAVATATNQTWDEAYWGLSVEGFIVKNVFPENPVWGSYLRRCGFRRYPIEDTCPDCTVAEFAETHPHGTYVLATGKHAVATIDGCYYDSFDSGDEPLLYYWKRENDGIS